MNAYTCCIILLKYQPHKAHVKRLHCVVIVQLLDVISGSQRASQGPQPRLNAVAQRIYRRSGVEVTSVFDLKDDDEIWVSYGEPFISPFSECFIGNAFGSVEFLSLEHLSNSNF